MTMFPVNRPYPVRWDQPPARVDVVNGNVQVDPQYSPRPYDEQPDVVGNDNRTLAWIATNAPRIPWDRFTEQVFRPLPGEHCGIIGATGQGKTHLQNSILRFWPFVAVFGTKNTDVTMDRLLRSGGYERFDKWYQLSALDHPRRVIWPRVRNLKEQTGVQRATFENAIEHIWAEGGRPPERPVGWAIAMDELWWFSNKLAMDEYIKVILLQGRSNGISLIAATQRPAWVPVELYSSSTHLFFFAENDSRNLQRIGEINHRDKRGIRHIVSTLEPHQVLYVNTRTGRMVRTRAPKPIE